MLDQQEIYRYSRQILLPEIGLQGQEKLKAGRVLVVGAGGLGTPILSYLTGAGIGTIGIAEFDQVDISNLPRQFLYGTDDSGARKIDIAAAHLRKLNPTVLINIHDQYLNKSNILEIIQQYDLIIDGSDNLPTRYLVNDACLLQHLPLVYGAIYKYEGQAGFFNLPLPDGSRSANYRDLFPVPPPPELVPSCSEGGVIGPLAGIIGSIMAGEAIKFFVGMGSLLQNQILLVDALDLSFRKIKLLPDPERPEIIELIDYEAFCNPEKSQLQKLPALTPVEAHQLMRQNKLAVIDVREPHEFNLANIGGINLPAGELMDHIARIPRRTSVLVICKSGARSMRALEKLKNLGFDNAYTLNGGLNRWRIEIDPALPDC